MNMLQMALSYPETAKALYPLTEINHDDPSDQEAFSQAKDQLIKSLSSNPELPGNMERQLESNPALKDEILGLAQNDPKALNEMMPDLIANSGNMAEILARHQKPPAAEQQVVEHPTEQAGPAPENQLPPIDLVAMPEPATGAAVSSVRNEPPPPEAQEATQEALAERSIAMGGMTTTAHPTIFNSHAKGSGQGTAQANKAEAEASASADKSSGQQVEAAPSSQEQILEIMTELRGKPGGEEFFGRVANDPTLGTALNNAMTGEGGDPAHMLETLKDVRKMAAEDDRLFVKVNKYMDDHPGAMQTFAGTFANDPDKAFMDLKMGMMTDNIQNMLEGPLTSLLGPELAGKIMGWIAPIMQLFTGFSEMFPEEQDTVSQSNSNKPLSSEVQEVKISISVDQNGKPNAKVDNAPKQEDELENNRQGQGAPTATAPGL